jgi:chromosome partitioning protein
MSTYALWNNKGGVGKSYLTFQIACEYARTHPDEKILVLDMCPQANASGMLLGGIVKGEAKLLELSQAAQRLTISGYVRERIASPYHNPRSGSRFLLQVNQHNSHVPENLYLVPGDDELEMLAARVSHATEPGVDNAWQLVHLWLSDLIGDVRASWQASSITTFIDCAPSFGVYTELAMSAADRLIIPFSSDGSSRRAVRAVLALLYGSGGGDRVGAEQSQFSLRSAQFRMSIPKIYFYVGNRLTQSRRSSAAAFKSVVDEIGTAIWDVWRSRGANCFYVHPTGNPPPSTRPAFKRMFQHEIVDANTASVVSSALGIPIFALRAGLYDLLGDNVMVNKSQLDKQVPNLEELVGSIEP